MSHADRPRSPGRGLVEDATVVSIAHVQRCVHISGRHEEAGGGMSREGVLQGRVHFRVRVDGLEGRLELWDMAGPRVAAQAAADTFVLVATRPYFGGTRWWAVCPCGRRVAILYGVRGTSSFGCRACAGLVYASQREDATARLARQAAKLRERLGEGGLWPLAFARGSSRPLGMRRRTYHRLRVEIARLDETLVTLAAYAVARDLAGIDPVSAPADRRGRPRKNFRNFRQT